MKSTSEISDATNVANFEDAIAICLVIPDYNPGNPALQIPTLQKQYTHAKQVLSDTKDAGGLVTKCINDRQYGFDPLPRFATRLINALIASDCDKKILADARTINRKLQGGRASDTKAIPQAPIPDGTNPEDIQKQISVSQQSMDKLVDNMSKLIKIAQAETGYAPNEADLTKDGLNTYMDYLNGLNTAVINADTAWANERIKKNLFLYAESTGLIETSKKIKSYVKSIDKTGEFFNLINKIQFKTILPRPRKKK